VACDIGEDSAFVSDMVNLLKTDDFWLPEYLESINFGVELVIKGDMRGCGGTDEADSGKGSF
jgi:hypothetical protein